MRSVLYPLLLSVCTSLMAQGAQESIDETPYRKTVEGFSAGFWLTKEESFFSDWDNSAPPELEVAREARRNEPLYTVVLFNNPGRTSEGRAEVTLDLILKYEDGSTTLELEDISCWSGSLGGEPRMLHLCPSYLALTMEAADPLGEYTARIVVRDHVKDVELELERQYILRKE
ncbi:hypothetical protein QWY84_16180 [Aquisalimonas lutea]|uniref:hypothetical protein n=1 Tax=Aquisalimonas lutea TaxID=1327750 RepID=UPI0025B5C83A|nr:hypothetical protein [Aquisalimonas lutea]MDN3519154.1 hypothetical protein [Aquisalimonas lutea]